MFARARALPCVLLASCASWTPPAPVTAPTDGWAKWVETCGDWDEWDKPGPPFQLGPDTYYVGTCGISAILVTGDRGHILIDSGPATAAPLIARNIEVLGARLSDVKLLLHSHEHHDHVGGIAELQRLTGARLLASRDAALALASGRAAADDPQLAEGSTFPPARVDGVVEDGKPVRLGNLTLTPVATPGHTSGALSWRWTGCYGDICFDMAYVDSLTPVSSDGYRFSDHPAYLAAFRTSLSRVAELRCNRLMTPHPSASGIRRGPLQTLSCTEYAAALSQRLDERLAQEVAQ